MSHVAAPLRASFFSEPSIDIVGRFDVLSRTRQLTDGFETDLAHRSSPLGGIIA